MKTLVLATILSAVAVTANAGPRFGGLKNAEKEIAGFTHNVTNASKSEWATFAAMVSNAKKGHSFGDIGSTRMGLVVEEKGRTLLYTLERNPNTGDLKKTEIVVPPSDFESTLHIFDKEDGVAVRRRFDTPSGEIEIVQNLKVEKLEKNVRNQNSFDVQTANMRGTVKTQTDSFRVTTATRDGKLLGFAEFSKDLFDGTVVGFNLVSDGTYVKFYIKQGDKFIEEVYTLTPTKPMGSGQQELAVNRIAFSRMTSQEVKRLGLLAEEKVIAGRKASTKSAGGMQVGSSVGDSAAKSSGLQ